MPRGKLLLHKLEFEADDSGSRSRGVRPNFTKICSNLENNINPEFLSHVYISDWDMKDTDREMVNGAVRRVAWKLLDEHQHVISFVVDGTITGIDAMTFLECVCQNGHFHLGDWGQVEDGEKPSTIYPLFVERAIRKNLRTFSSEDVWWGTSGEEWQKYSDCGLKFPYPGARQDWVSDNRPPSYVAVIPSNPEQRKATLARVARDYADFNADDDKYRYIDGKKYLYRDESGLHEVRNCGMILATREQYHAMRLLESTE